MKKILQGLFVFVAAALLLGSAMPTLAGSKTLSLITWEGYVTDKMIADFKEQTGITVEVTYIANNDELISKMRATGGEGYDLAQPSIDNTPEAQRNFGIYQPLDFSKIKIMDNIIPSLAKAVTRMSTIDGKVYSIPYTWGTSGIIVNTEKIRKKSYSYMDLYDPKWCGRVTTRFRWPTFAGAGYGLGWNVFRNFKSEFLFKNMIENITDFLISRKKCIRTYWTTRQQNIDLMASGECWISQGWDGTGWLLSKKYPYIKFFAPEEGALGWIDTFCISAGAENIEGAYKWINFVMTPEKAGELIEKGGFLSAVKGATDYLAPEQKRLIRESFPPAAIANINWYPTIPSYVNELRAQAEEKLKAAR
ncbi:MAG: extracellular solute-binding protein [Deltaproteobacteria bacterium]|nr:extracellular solute-binding protein [Deltaproteobacteria bacterium]MBW2123006.1 extracellular solute-binding protein [Deltaproteobacteria bacterium]